MQQIANSNRVITFRKQVTQSVKVPQSVCSFFCLQLAGARCASSNSQTFSPMQLPTAQFRFRDAETCCRRRRSEYQRFHPKYFVLIAEHSMCQPGLPFPSSVSQNTSPSSGVHAFQRAKSWASSLAYSSWQTLAPALSSQLSCGTTCRIREI
jgi:hypothetical protein